MNEILKEIEISAQLAAYIQRLNYEVEGFKSIMRIIINGTDKYTTKMYDYHIEKFKASNNEYRLAINELTKEYGGEFTDKNLDIHVDFNTNVLQVIDKGRKEISCCKK